LTQNHSSS
jgi:hypothetical protein